MASTTRATDSKHAPAGGRGAERIDQISAIEWGKSNGVRATPADTFLARLNSRRAELRLPRWLIDQKASAKPLGTRPQPAPPPVKPLAGSEDQLLDLVSAHHGTLTGLVTPQIAAWLLELNTGNRPMMKNHLERFRAILKSGQWQNTGEPVIVSQEGVLNDGQHRLLAIRDTKISAVMDVRFGIPREAFNATGFGRSRRTAHVLGMEGYSNTTCQASMARLLHAYDRKQMGTVRQTVLEPSEALRILEEDDHIGHIAARIQRLSFPPCRCAGFGFPLVVAARKLDVEKVFMFAKLVASGLSEREDAPTYRLNRKLSEMFSRRERILPVDLSALTIKAWNAWVADDHLGPLKVVDAERTSAKFPQLKWG